MQSSKIDAALKKKLQRHGHANILLSMKEGTQDILDELNQMSFSSRTERSQALYDALTKRAEDSQSTILRLLSSPSVLGKFKFLNVRSFWITNQIAIDSATDGFVAYLASMDEISSIQEDEIAELYKPTENRLSDDPPGITANQWGITKIQVAEAWLLFGGTRGSGITVANIDTGVRYTHDILRTTYKNDGYSWYDPYNKTQNPADYNGHGTHTMGTIVGQNGYGVAPQAKWIACKGLYDDGAGSGANLLACGQFLVCPTTYNGQSADCSKTPDVVNNSWGSSTSGSTYYDSMFAAFHTAGIIPVFSIGNTGTACSTAKSPGDRDVIAVGSTTSTDSLSTFSSVGPTPDHRVKPDISAPGTSVTSADYTSDTTYRTMSGTSMAAPHVAGSIALLLNRNPSLTYVQIRNLIIAHTDRTLVFSNASCGFLKDSVFPNHHFGAGRLNINRALQALA